MHTITIWLKQLSTWVWGLPLVGLLIATGLFLTLLLGGVQFRFLGHAFMQLFWRPKKKSEGDITPFQALSTSLGGTIGTGNIAGVATAIAIGGVGSIFWLWISGLIGMATTFGESILSVRFRHVNVRGRIAGGPMYTIRDGLGWKWLAVCYALFAILASFGMGNLVQAHSIADALHTAVGLPQIWSGVVLAWLIGLALVGGIRSIGKVSGYLVPAMGFFYLTGGVVILILHYTAIPSALWLIVRSAFTGQAAVGGFVGASAMMAMRMGMSRGIFSNEAGLGSNAIAAAAAQVDLPGRQAMIAMTGTFIDTLVVCTITGLTIAVTGVLGTPDPEGGILTGVKLTALAFGNVIPGGGMLVSFALVLFASTTILAWAYYGEKALEFLVGTRSRIAYRVLFIVVLLVGSLLSLDAVWAFADIANGLMAIPNLISLLALSGIIVSEMRLYLTSCSTQSS